MVGGAGDLYGITKLRDPDDLYAFESVEGRRSCHPARRGVGPLAPALQLERGKLVQCLSYFHEFRRVFSAICGTVWFHFCLICCSLVACCGGMLGFVGMLSICGFFVFLTKWVEHEKYFLCFNWCHLVFNKFIPNSFT